MPRLARIVMPGMPHHVTHRGNRKYVIFRDDHDRKTYLRILREQCVKLALRIWAYALMINHVHLIAVPSKEETMGAVLRNAHGTYTDYFNTKYSQVGHLFGGRYKSAVLDEAYLFNAVRYVERNPVRAGIVARAEDYRWSSAAAHCGLREDLLLSDDLPLLSQITDWSVWLGYELTQDEISFIRSRTHTGRPCGDDRFLRELGKQLGRDLLPKKRGPAKGTSANRALPFGE
jgi:putative transposase